MTKTRKGVYQTRFSRNFLCKCDNHNDFQFVRKHMKLSTVNHKLCPNKFCFKSLVISHTINYSLNTFEISNDTVISIVDFIVIIRSDKYLND